MSDIKTESGDPDERAFTGHPDHPPEQPDQPAEENQELLDQKSGASMATSRAETRPERRFPATAEAAQEMCG